MNHSSKEQEQKQDETNSMDVLPAMDQADPMFRRIAMQSSPFEILRTDMAGGKHLNMNQEKLYEENSKQKIQQPPTPVHYNVEIIASPITLPPETAQEMENTQQQEQRVQRLLAEAKDEFMVDSIPEIEEDAIDPVDPVCQVAVQSPMGTTMATHVNLIIEQVIQGCCQLKWTEVQLGLEWSIQLRTLTGIEEMEWEIRFGQKAQHELMVMFHLIAGQNEQWYLDSIDQLVSICPDLQDPKIMHATHVGDSAGSLYPQCTASNLEELAQLFQDMNMNEPEHQSFVRHNAIQAANRLAILSQDKPTRMQWLTQQNELMNGLYMMLHHSVMELQCASLFVFLTFLDDHGTTSPCFSMTEVQARTQAIRQQQQQEKQQTILSKLATQLQRYGC